MIDLQGLLPNLPFQLGLLRVHPSAACQNPERRCPAPHGTRVASVTNMGVFLEGPRDFGIVDPVSSRRTAANFTSRVNVRRGTPMTQFSI